MKKISETKRLSLERESYNMHALVFWFKSKTTSVVNIKDLVPDKEEGEITHARCQSNSRLYYKAKIIRKSDVAEYLHFLRVSTDGQILTKGKTVNGRIAMDESNELKRRAKEAAENAKQNNKKRHLNLPAIFDDSSERDSSELAPRAPEDGKNIKSEEEENEERQEEIDNLTRDYSEQVEQQKEHTEESYCEDTVRADDLSNRNTPVRNLEDDPLKQCRIEGNGREQLCDCFNVWIDSAKLASLSRWFKRPREMTRRLLHILVGRENLKNMCARGRSKQRPGIPEDILNSIEYYVNKKCEVQLDTVEFTNVVNFMCTTLRHPKQ